MNDLTEGPILSKVLRFALPLMAANLVNQLYNVVDTIIVGYAIGDYGIAAVGISFPIMMLFNALFMGVSMGGSIIISQMYGAKNFERLNKAVNSTVFLALMMGLVITGIGLTLSRPLLRLLNTPQEIIGGASLYLMIIFGGTCGNLFFNLGSGIIRGMGDSKWPLYAIITSTCINICLDTLFTLILRMGVAGVAIATLIAQFSSGIILMLRINRGGYSMKISPAQVIKPDSFILKNIVRLGLPSGLQGMAMSLGGLIMQRFGNSFGAEFVTANAVIQRVDGFAIMPLMGLGMAMTTFSGQNIGAGNPKRAQKGIYVTLATILTIAAFLGVVMWFAGGAIISIFSVSDHVMEMGKRGIRIICFFYAFMGMDHCIAGAMRGAGAAIRPVINSFIAQICRLTLTFALAIVPLDRAIRVAVESGEYASADLARAAGVGTEWYYRVYYAMALGMVIGAVLNFLYFKFGNWQDKGLEQRRLRAEAAKSS
ncbi:MAG: MATE family efflux transporter [Oscillospiraceae bacterium]|nr:MATE family efflux transporter [Oscillospiraceae bacterium]